MPAVGLAGEKRGAALATPPHPVDARPDEVDVSSGIEVPVLRPITYRALSRRGLHGNFPIHFVAPEAQLNAVHNRVFTSHTPTNTTKYTHWSYIHTSFVNIHHPPIFVRVLVDFAIADIPFMVTWTLPLPMMVTKAFSGK